MEGVDWNPSTSSREVTYLEINGPEDILLKTDGEFVKNLEFWDGLPLNEDKDIFIVKNEL